MQFSVFTTRRVLAITLLCIASTLLCVASSVVLLDGVVLRLPSHSGFSLEARWLAVSGSVVMLTLVAVLVTRIQALVRMARDAQSNESRFFAASESSYDAFCILESVRDVYGEIAEFRFVYLNANAAKLVSSTPKELTGKLLCDTFPIYRTSNLFATYKQVVETGERVRAEFPIDAKDIQASWLSHQVVKLGDGVAITTRDTTDTKQKELMLVYLAHHDSLTGLARRELFDERLDSAMKLADEHQHLVGLLIVDFDYFKRVNDMLGHQAGDELIIQIANRLQAAVRKSDTVARMGGDEFMIVLGALSDADHAASIAEKLLLWFHTPMLVAGQTIPMTASIGVSVYPRDGRRAEELLKNADAAMYQAKADGRNRVQSFTPEMAERLVRRREVENGLQHALEREELELVYQPRINLLTGKVNGVEALLRWRSAELGMVMPGEFIAIAEENGLIVPIGRWVMETACRELSRLYPEGGRPMMLAVNVSPRQFQHDSLARDIAASLQLHPIDRRCLEIEITESMLMHESPHSKRIFDAVRAQGVSIAIDDFGTGYSSMSYLMRFQAERLKIDQTFVRNMTRDPESDAICRALIGLGKALSLIVVAEGVETDLHRDLLWAMGCEEAQGNLYSVPVPIDELQATVEMIERAAVSRFAAA